MFFKVFLRKIISTINNSSYTSQIHYRNALHLDPVILFVSAFMIIYFSTDELLFESYTVPLAYACFSNFIKFANILVKILVTVS